jgi:hypothetical protein
MKTNDCVIQMNAHRPTSAWAGRVAVAGLLVPVAAVHVQHPHVVQQHAVCIHAAKHIHLHAAHTSTQHMACRHASKQHTRSRGNPTQRQHIRLDYMREGRRWSVAGPGRRPTGPACMLSEGTASKTAAPTLLSCVCARTTTALAPQQLQHMTPTSSSSSWQPITHLVAYAGGRVHEARGGVVRPRGAHGGPLEGVQRQQVGVRHSYLALPAAKHLHLILNSNTTGE